MRPSNQPRLAPNGGSSLKPAWFLLAIPAVMASTLVPPLGVTLLVGGGILLVVKLGNRVGSKSRARVEAVQHRQRMDDYYRRREAQQWCDNWNNPGWRP